MELLTGFLDLLLHLDRHLLWVLQHYGLWIYALLFLIVFVETGLVVAPFLPGDSLLFVAGALAAAGGLDVFAVGGLLILAAILGDSLNYTIGKYLGPKVFQRPDGRFFKREHLDRTHAFYDRHGGKTVVIARFVPIVRTFAPFVAGIGRMPYPRFLAYNVGGAVLWVVSLVGAGYFFGNVPFIKNNLTAVILGIIVLSLVPVFVETWRHRRQSISRR